MKATILILTLAAAAAPAARATAIAGPFTFDFSLGASGTGAGSESSNTITLFENWTANGLLGVEFNLVDPPSGPEDYSFTKTVTNNTGITWTDFQIGWGCGDGTTVCSGFQPLTNNFPVAPTISGTGVGGAVLSVDNAAYLEWNNLDIQNGQTATFTFSLVTCPDCSGTWQIQQVPSTAETPEVASLAMVGFGLFALGAFPLRRRLCMLYA
jgi:hypothetical protein